MCCLKRGTKAASDSNVGAQSDMAPIKEATEQTGSGGKEQRDGMTQRDEQGTQSGGRGEYGTQTQSEQRKKNIFFVLVL